MINLHVQSTHFKVFYDQATDEEIHQSENLIRSRFQAEDSTLKHSPAVKRGFQSAIRSFYISTKENPKDSENLLLVGFLDELIELYKENNIKYEVKDVRKYPAVDKQYVKDLHAGKITFGKYVPRDYQVEAVLAVAQNKMGIINAVMSAGKTLMAAMICKLYPKTKILLLFDGVSLIHQTYKDFIHEYGFSTNEVGIIQGKNCDDDKRIIMLSMDSYEKAIELFPQFKVIVADECHQTASSVDNTSARVLYSCQNATIRVGLSATPDVIDNPYRQKSLYGNMGPIIFTAKIKDKMDDGTLAHTTVEMIKVDGFILPIIGSYADIYETKKIKKRDIKEFEKNGYEVIYKDDEYTARKFIAQGDESTSYVFNERRNQIIADTVRNNRGRRVVLFSRMEHGTELARLIPDALLVHGKSDAEQREEAKQYLLDNPNGIVLASRIWDEGVNIKWLETLIIASAGVSTTRTIQRLGRALRKSAETGKTTAKVIDFLDMFNPLVKKQSSKRLHTYSKVLGFNVKYEK